MKITKAEVEQAIEECKKAIKDENLLITSETEIKLGIEADGDMAVVVIARPYNNPQKTTNLLAYLLPHRIRALGRKHGEKYVTVVLPGNYFDRYYKEQNGFVELGQETVQKPTRIELVALPRPHDEYMRVYIDQQDTNHMVTRKMAMAWLARVGVTVP
jgi:hypothetical protein